MEEEEEEEEEEEHELRQLEEACASIIFYGVPEIYDKPTI